MIYRILILLLRGTAAQTVRADRPNIEMALQNLADDPGHADLKNRLHQRLMGELERTGDPRVSSDISFEKPPFTDSRSPNQIRIRSKPKK